MIIWDQLSGKDHSWCRCWFDFNSPEIHYYQNRAIFDTDECENFTEKLETRIHVHDRDIEKLCSAHHQGFIESIKDLLELKGLANKINVPQDYIYFIPSFK